MRLYLTGQVLQSDFSDVVDGAQAFPLRALPLVDGLSVDGVPQLLSSRRRLLLVHLKQKDGITEVRQNHRYT